MKWAMVFQEGWRNLLARKLRSVLALMGILVGTASVVAMMTSGKLATNEALKQFKLLGTDLLAVTISDQTAFSSSGSHASLSLDQAKDLLHVDPGILKVAPYVQVYDPMQFNGHALEGAVFGVTENFAIITHLQMASGRFISDMDHTAPFCVIGDELYQQIRQFTRVNPIGQQIQVGRHVFTIMGIAALSSQNSFVNGNVNHAILVPIQTAFLSNAYAAINSILLQLSEKAESDHVEKHVEDYLRKNLSGKQTLFRDAKELVLRMEKQNAIFTVFLGLIGGVSLLVGGIGVMNIMLVSVVERRREIGIRLAVGATRRNIQFLFLVEAVMLAMAGGFLGVIIGMGVAYVVALYSDWPFTLFLMPPLIGFVVSVATGIFFGFYPAYQASRWDPVVALRME
ncbi:MAG TPA: ABC transporter permease [Gammaproteobacteria bacterium]|nr:ABC transporter permease [Gammaproteobacteria bacterium]